MDGRNILGTLVVVVATLLTRTSATTYNVGNTTGWMVPPNGAATYSTWASQHTFYVGDILVFNFQTGVHTAANVTSDAFNNCNTANPLFIETTGPASYTLQSPGVDYFICTMSNHCLQGQKLQVTVTSLAPGTTPSGSNTIPPPPPPPPHSSAPPSSIATFSLIISIAIANLFCYI